MSSPISKEEKIRSQLRPGERLLWWGIPQRRRFLGEMIANAFLGILPFLFGLLILFHLARFHFQEGIHSANPPGLMLGTFIGALFCWLGTVCFLSPWKMATRLGYVVYAITDQRALVLTSRKRSWNPVQAYSKGESHIEFSAGHLRNYRKTWRDFGRTDLIFYREWRKALFGGGAWNYFGFFGLDHPEEPEQIIKEFYLASDPPILKQAG